jgi:integrase/recombinase XerD
MARPIDANRRALPVSEWPEPDQRAWRQAIAEGDVLDQRGPATHWRAKTKCTNIQHYGRWLSFLAGRGPLNAKVHPAERVTASSVGAYNEHLKTIVAPRTRLSMLVGLKVMMKAMAPDRSWRWLQDTCNRVQRVAEPSKDKRSRIRSTPELFSAAVKLLESLPPGALDLRNAIRYRDALMLACLATRPLRVKNFTSIVIGRHLRDIDGRWLLTFPAAEMKTAQPIEFYVPAELVKWLERYLLEVRTAFPEAATTQQLWLNRDGVVAPGFVYARITKLTYKLFGVRINPHLLRDCVASSLALVSTDAARAAASVLGHRQFSTTERYYIQANNLEASRRVNDVLARARSNLENAK